MICEKNLAA